MRSFGNSTGLLSWKIMLFTVCLLFIHVAGIKNEALGYVVFGIENLILVYIAFNRKLNIYLYYLLLVLPITFEQVSFVDENATGQFNSLVTFYPFQGYLFLLILVSFIPTILSKKNWKLIINKPIFKVLYYFAYYLVLIAILFGVIVMFIDDVSIGFKLVCFFRHILKYGAYSLLMLYFIYSCRDSNFVTNISSILFSSISGIIIASFILALMGLSGNYAGEPIILAPLSLFYSTSIVVFLFFKEYRCKYKYHIIILTFIAFYMQITYSNALGGKSWLVLPFLLFFVLRILQKKSVVLFTIISFLFVISLPFINSFVENKIHEGGHASGKLVQAMALIQFNENSLEDIPGSPRARINEFINTTIEYYHNPQLLFLGKGYGGGHRDHINGYTLFQKGAFSQEESVHRYYVNLHESLNVIFLSSGLYGLIIFIIILYKGIKKSYLTPWLVIGTLWFSLYWGYSYSLLLIGMPSLVLGFVQASENSSIEK